WVARLPTNARLDRFTRSVYVHARRGALPGNRSGRCPFTVWHSTCFATDMSWRHRLSAFSIATLIFAQENPVTTFRTESNLVSLNVSVFDREGRVLKGLPQSAFTVFEDNQKQEIKIFRQEDVPISMGL